MGSRKEVVNNKKDYVKVCTNIRLEISFEFFLILWIKNPIINVSLSTSKKTLNVQPMGVTLGKQVFKFIIPIGVTPGKKVLNFN